MKTNQLRLGNWVEEGSYGNRSIPMQVAAIFDDTVYLDFEGNEGDVWEEEDKSLLGIPLTNEILSQVFEAYPHKFEFDDIIILKDGLKDNVFNVHYGNIFIREIKYVHELQNICFALTGEELKIEL
jgi:hypothetical protein